MEGKTLTRNERFLRRLAQKYGSFYLYDETVIHRYTGQLLKDFPEIQFLYSLKTNPHPHVAKSVFSQGFGADAASLKEVEMAVKGGLGRGDIYYSAPGKTEEDIRGAIPHAILIADSLREMELIDRIAGETGRTVSVGVRLNPGFSFRDGCGHPSKFGIDEDQALAAIPRWNALPHIRVTGIHVHLRSQELNAGVLGEYYRRMFRLAERFQNALGRELEFLNMGSGIGIQYSPKDAPLDTAALGAAVREQLERFRERLPKTKVIIEAGRYAVGKAGIYVTQVLDKKVSGGKTFLILANTLNGFLRPSLVRLVMKYAGDTAPAGSEPLFTCPDAFDFLAFPQEKAGEERVTLMGNLCTACDVIAEDVFLPTLQPGDFIALTNAGSYGAVLSPMQFSSQKPPAELFLSRSGEILEE